MASKLYSGVRALIFSFALVSVIFPIPSVAPPKGMIVVPCDEGICEYRLKNGLLVLPLSNVGKPIATISIVYSADPGHEDYGKIGMANFLEPQLFRSRIFS